MDLSFSKNDHFSPPLDSLRSWVLSARSEVLLYYTVEAVPSTQWRKSNGFQVLYMSSYGGLCSAFQFFSQEPTTSLLLSIPYLVWFSVSAQRCLLTILSKRFLPHSGENLMGYNLYTSIIILFTLRPVNDATEGHTQEAPMCAS